MNKNESKSEIDRNELIRSYLSGSDEISPYRYLDRVVLIFDDAGIFEHYVMNGDPHRYWGEHVVSCSDEMSVTVYSDIRFNGTLIGYSYAFEDIKLAINREVGSLLETEKSFKVLAKSINRLANYMKRR